MFQLDLDPITIQGIAKYDAISKKLIIGDTPPFTEIKFNGYGAYIRKTGSKKPKQKTQTECDKWLYKVSVEYVFVYFDFLNKFTLESVEKTVFSQLNQSEVEITDIQSDFATIKKDENLKEMKDANLLKITFEATEDFINDCDGLICVC